MENKKNLTEFNRRQINLMIQKIELFLNNELNLPSLIEDLEALLDFMENIDQPWKDIFLNYWWKLETINSLILERLEKEKFYIEKEEERILFNTINSLKEFLENSLK